MGYYYIKILQDEYTINQKTTAFVTFVNILLVISFVINFYIIPLYIDVNDVEKVKNEGYVLKYNLIIIKSINLARALRVLSYISQFTIFFIAFSITALISFLANDTD